MKTTITTLILLMTLVDSTAFSAEKTKKITKQMVLTQDQRNSMATRHENMAICLRSGKALDSCRVEMMKGCMDTMRKDGCPHMMWEMHGKGMEKMHESMMEEKEEDKK